MPEFQFKIKGLPQPQFNYRFHAFIQDENELSKRIQSVDPPFMGHETEGIHIGGTKDYHPTFVDIPSVSVVFKEDNKATVLKGLTAWKERVQNANGTFNYPSAYKRTITIELLDGQNRMHTTYKLLGCFPVGTTMEGYNYTEQDIIIITQEFSVDGSEVVRTN